MNRELWLGTECKPEIQRELNLCYNCVEFSKLRSVVCNFCEDKSSFTRKEVETTKTQCKEEREVSTELNKGRAGIDPSPVCPNCKWTENTDFDGEPLWDTECGETFVLIDGSTPSENHFQFCPHCGREIKEVMEVNHE